MRVSGISLRLLLLAAFAAGGCDLQARSLAGGDEPAWDGPATRPAPPPGSLYERFQSENPSVRVQAALEAGRRKDPRSVPYLIDRLTDGEAEVRFAAIQSLERITGATHGYRFHARSDQREEAARRWRRWLEEARRGTASRGAAQPTAAPKEGGP